jgi:hypothetical protein
MFEIFKHLEDYNKYFEDQLNLSGTILGLVVATSTFILQSGFTSFEYSRSMFLKYYVHQSKFIFLSLAYNIIFPAIVLYLNCNEKFLFGAHVLFGLVFSKYFLDFYSHKGYIVTIHSTKYNPYKNGLLKYFRYINNLGILHSIFIYGTIYLIFLYPLHFNQAWRLNYYQVYMTTISCLLFSIIVVIRIIPQFFTFSEQEYESKTKNEVIDNLDVDVSKENIILKDILIKNGRKEIDGLIQNKKFESLMVNMPTNKKEAFFVINIEVKNKNVFEIVNLIEQYSYDFFIELEDISVDVNNFVLSYFIKIKGEKKTRNYFIRANRKEIKELKGKYLEPKSFIENLSNKLIDELFRNL